MKKGMIPEDVDKIATDITTAVEDVDTYYNDAYSALTELDWTGDDRDRFVSDFEEQVGGLLTTLKQAASDMATRATTNANEQRNASA
ncbi:hypothetical protein BRM3_08175 [Brachybacterium huguangmaarense]|uniref:WXG100 family type VII secretion target n=1 Tax=Brachybacterium huguangmaarense TaxID=1652028 RepID=A0ABY6FXI7_9MICO|nr:hypothetical protein [Brachybacterium huguangmaarense]UYG15625.1 hypothetical protein BRM3_08175 [Brachybacterium huguangmaarense]